MVKYSLFKYGDPIGVFTFIEVTGTKNGGLIGEVQCFCGNVIEAKLYRAALHMKSCGCVSKRKLKGLNHPNATHGVSHTLEYRTWRSMIRRCMPHSRDHKNYFDRGIIVCDRWLNSFDDFLSDMGTKPSPELSIEREDNDGIYEPSNCKWGTEFEQANNRRRNVFITYNGERKTVAQWSRDTGIYDATISYRHSIGFTAKDIFTMPLRTKIENRGDKHLCLNPPNQPLIIKYAA